MNLEFLSKTEIGLLLNKAEIKGDFKIVPLHGGNNNRVFRIDMDNTHYCLKSYFNNPDDSRDRFGIEFGFLDYAWQMAIRTLPQPLAMDRKNNLGLYEFIKGRKLRFREVTEKRVDEALKLYQALNHHRGTPRAKKLPNGSEACFSINDHLGTIEKRLERLSLIEGSSLINKEAIQFIKGDLSETWRKVFDSVNERAREIGISMEKEIQSSDRCLSPSDFGFHNAILTADNTLRFIDFEYAGWDDPAKMVCDFFCQPAVPVPLEYYDMFTQVVIADSNEPENHLKRFEMLLPVYQIKWCCIMLNDFLPTEVRRRRFANNSVDQTEQKKQQLQKARDALQEVRSAK